MLVVSTLITFSWSFLNLTCKYNIILSNLYEYCKASFITLLNVVQAEYRTVRPGY